MDNIEKEILCLVQSKAKSADKMTSAFKFIGRGSMENGIKRFARFFPILVIAKENGLEF